MDSNAALTKKDFMHGVKGYSTFWEAMCLRYYEYIPGVNQPEEKDIGGGYTDWIRKVGPRIGSHNCI